MTKKVLADTSKDQVNNLKTFLDIAYPASVRSTNRIEEKQEALICIRTA